MIACMWALAPLVVIYRKPVLRARYALCSKLCTTMIKYSSRTHLLQLLEQQSRLLGPELRRKRKVREGLGLLVPARQHGCSQTVCCGHGNCRLCMLRSGQTIHGCQCNCPCLHTRTSRSRSWSFADRPNKLFANVAAAFEGPAPSSGVHISLPVTKSRSAIVPRDCRS